MLGLISKAFEDFSYHRRRPYFRIILQLLKTLDSFNGARVNKIVEIFASTMKEQEDVWKELDTMIEHLIRLCEQDLSFRQTVGSSYQKLGWLLHWLEHNENFTKRNYNNVTMYLFQKNKPSNIQFLKCELPCSFFTQLHVL